MHYGDIRIYDQDFALITILPRYISVNWKLEFGAYGTAEIHLEKTAAITSLLTENRYLFLEQDDHQALVTGVRIEETECIVFARTLEWLLTKFLVHDFFAERGETASAVACRLVATALPEDVTLYTSGEDSVLTDASTFAIEEATDVYHAVCDCLADEKVGFSFIYDKERGGFLFSVMRAVENSTLILNEEYKTAYNQSFTKDLQQEASGGVYYHKVTNGGKWDPETNEPQLSLDETNLGMYYTASGSGHAFGFGIREGDILLCKSKSGYFEIVEEAKPFLVTFQPQQQGIFSWSAVLDSQTDAEAVRELAMKKQETLVDCETKKLVFGTDFQLGNIVWVQFTEEAFVYAEKQIVKSVHIWDDSEGYGCVPTCVQLTKEEEDVISL